MKPERWSPRLSLVLLAPAAAVVAACGSHGDPSAEPLGSTKSAIYDPAYANVDTPGASCSTTLRHPQRTTRPRACFGRTSHRLCFRLMKGRIRPSAIRRRIAGSSSTRPTTSQTAACAFDGTPAFPRCSTSKHARSYAGHRRSAAAAPKTSDGGSPSTSTRSTWLLSPVAGRSASPTS